MIGNDRLESVEILGQALKTLKGEATVIVKDDAGKSEQNEPDKSFGVGVVEETESGVTMFFRAIDRLFEDAAELKNKDPAAQQEIELIRRVLAQSVDLVLYDPTMPNLFPSLVAKSDVAVFVELAVQAVHLNKRLSAPREAFKARRAKLLLEGKLQFEKLLDEAGGVYKLSEVKSLLKKKTDAIRKRVVRNTLIGRKDEFPTWQFDAKDGVIREVSQVSQLLEHTDYVGKCLFFLTPCDDLEGKTPLEALTTGTSTERETRLNIVKRLARQYLKQGAR